MNSPAKARLQGVPPGEGESLRPLDWPGLCARLLAGHQLSRTLDALRGTRASSGSFAPSAARGLTGEPPRRVNLEPSALGKAGHDISPGNDSS